MTKTRKDVMYAMLDEMAADAIGREALRRDFEKNLVPLLAKDPQWKEPLTEEEFVGDMQAMRKSFPAFIARLNASDTRSSKRRKR